MRILSIPLVALLLSLIFFGSIYPVSYAKTPVTGKLIDQRHGKPIDAATVVLVPGQAYVLTDSSGQFTLTGPGLGLRMHLRMSHLAYHPIDTMFTLTEAIATPLVFYMVPRIQELMEVSVMPFPASERTPIAFTRITAKELQPGNLGQDLPILLQQSIAVVSHSDAGTGVGYTGMRIRGSDGTRINVTLNGVPVNDAESQGVFWVNMPDLAGSVDEIQIQRGVGTSTSGTGAFGGSVHIKTQLSDDTAGVRMNLSGGSFGTLRQSLAVSSGALEGGWQFGGRLSRIRSDGYIERASADLSSLAVGALRQGHRSRLELNAIQGHERTYQAWYGVPQDSLAVRRTYNPAGVFFDAQGKLAYHPDEVDNYQQDHYQGIYEWQAQPNWALKGTVFYTRGKGYYEQYRADEPYERYGLPPFVLDGDTLLTTDMVRRRWLDNHFYGSLLQSEWTHGRWNVQSGGGWYEYRGAHFGEVIWARLSPSQSLPSRYYENDGHKTEYHLYTRTEWMAQSNWHLFGDVQYRSVDYRFEGLNNQNLAVDQRVPFRFFNPKAGVNWQAAPRLRWFASVAVGHREPVRDDLTASTPESRPTAEKLTDWETGVSWKGRNTQCDVQAYYMKYRDQLVLNGQINDVGAYVRVNVPESDRLGLEISWTTRVHRKLAWAANLCLSQNQVHNYTEYFDLYDANFNYLGNVGGQTQVVAPISFSPGITSGSTLSWSPLKALTIHLMSRHIGRQFLDNSGDAARALPAWTVHDLRIDHRIDSRSQRPAIRLNLQIGNMLNRRYSANGYTYPYLLDGNLVRDNYYFPQATRNVWLGLQVEF
ncbi:MAG: TonB-dependent receptor [Bacteroidetes bacterium]|nr:TonB-dependent receptor [Bacteroidota bacterium]